jgi:hypothetical protein
VITRQQIRRIGRKAIEESLTPDRPMPRRMRRALARQLEKADWQKRDKLAIERLKILGSVAASSTLR